MAKISIKKKDNFHVLDDSENLEILDMYTEPPITLEDTEEKDDANNSDSQT